LMRRCPCLVAGLSRAGFSGGWMEPVDPRRIVSGVATPVEGKQVVTQIEADTKK
jgi:hypothetical protein